MSLPEGPEQSRRPTSATLTLIDRQDDQRRNLARFFQSAGYTVRDLHALPVSSLQEGSLIETTDVALIALEQPLQPELDLLRVLKSQTTIGCIALTTRHGMQDRVAALEAGADMAYVKAADRQELLAAVKALIRRLPSAPTPIVPLPGLRQVGGHEGAASNHDQRLAVAPPSQMPCWTLTFASCSLTRPGGSIDTALTSVEFDLLSILMASPLRTISKQELLTVIGAGDGNGLRSSLQIGSTRLVGRGSHTMGNFHRIESALSRLRKKVLSSQGVALPIRAVFGEGLAFMAQARLE
jgi:DNA-binding response OmpR family regulator